MNRSLTDVIVELILDPVSGSDLSPLTWEEVICVLREVSLIGTVYHLADSRGVLDSFPALARHHLRSMSIYSARQAQQVRYECFEIERILGAVGIRPIFLKGAGYTLRQSRNSRGRIYTDIDVLVAADEIEPAQKALKQEAWIGKPLKKYDERYYRKWAHEIPPMKHLVRRGVLDLHHNIVPPISGNAPDPEYLRQSIEITGNGLRVLSPPAATLHSLVHLFTNEDFANGFRDIVDIYLLIDEFGDQRFWGELTTLAREWNFTAELYYGFCMVQDIFRYQIPGDVFDSLDSIHGGQTVSSLLLPLFRRSILPHHPLTRNRIDRLAAQLIYLRGHWIKMPLHILCMHLSIKAWYSLVEKIFGKHQFEKELTIPHN